MGSPLCSGGPSDRELWLRAGDGDSAAFGELFDRHVRAVYDHLFRRIADRSQADDLTSAVLLHAWRRRSTVVLDNESALPWLLGVANRVLRNQQRATRRYRAALARVTPAGQSVCTERELPDPRPAAGLVARQEAAGQSR